MKKIIAKFVELRDFVKRILQSKYKRSLVMNRYEEINEYVKDLIDDIENMKKYEHKFVCLFSMIDSFVQNYSSYDDRNNQENFCEFILKFADKEKYSYLSNIDPVTLNYDVSNKAYRFQELDKGNIYVPNSCSILKILSNTDLTSISDYKKKKHRYINLIYNARSKITHEGQSCGLVVFTTENEEFEPIYMDYTRYWQLIFPYTFLEELFVNCIENYLEYQKDKGLDPFDNNFDRKSFYAFYD